MRKFDGLMLAALALAGCNGDPQPAGNAADNGAVENAADATNYQAEVIALPLPARQGVFLRAVRDAGLTCQEVTESERRDDRQGNPTWRVICDRNSPHIISITRDGTAKIVSRTDAR